MSLLKLLTDTTIHSNENAGILFGEFFHLADISSGVLHIDAIGGTVITDIHIDAPGANKGLLHLVIGTGLTDAREPRDDHAVDMSGNTAGRL